MNHFQNGGHICRHSSRDVHHRDHAYANSTERGGQRDQEPRGSDQSQQVTGNLLHGAILILAHQR
jgi:hypothetical protein